VRYEPKNAVGARIALGCPRDQMQIQGNSEYPQRRLANAGRRTRRRQDRGATMLTPRYGEHARLLRPAFHKIARRKGSPPFAAFLLCGFGLRPCLPCPQGDENVRDRAIADCGDDPATSAESDFAGGLNERRL
jgi:hypothetical protein